MKSFEFLLGEEVQMCYLWCPNGLESLRSIGRAKEQHCIQ